MHIIVSILKIAGISAIVILLLLVFLLILLLFVPFYYRLYGRVSDKDSLGKREIEAKATVQLLLFLFRVSLEYTEEELKGVIRILGIPVKYIGKRKEKEKKEKEKEKETENTSKKEKKRGIIRKTIEKETIKEEEKEVKITKRQQRKEKEKEIKEVQEEVQEEIEVEKEMQKEIQKEQNDGTRDKNTIDEMIRDKNAKEENTRDENNVEKGQEIHKKRLFTPKYFWYKLKGYILTIINAWKKFCITKEKIINFWKNEHIRNGISIIWKQGKLGLKHILPKSVSLRLHFGCSDPAMTGQILGVFSIIYAFYGDAIEISPNFEQPILEGETELKGHMQLFFLLRIAWKLYRDKEVKYVIKEIKGIKEK